MGNSFLSLERSRCRLLEHSLISLERSLCLSLEHSFLSLELILCLSLKRSLFFSLKRSLERSLSLSFEQSILDSLERSLSLSLKRSLCFSLRSSAGSLHGLLSSLDSSLCVSLPAFSLELGLADCISFCLQLLCCALPHSVTRLKMNETGGCDVVQLGEHKIRYMQNVYHYLQYRLLLIRYTYVISDCVRLLP